MNTKEVETSAGKFLLKKPLAGARNEAVMKAETSDGIRNSVLMAELIPKCIVEHPFGTTPLRTALNGMEIEDYDKLVITMAELIAPQEADIEKKSDQPSEEESS